MNAHPTITELIAVHLAAVRVDDASFTDDGLAIDAEMAEKTGAAECQAFKRFVGTPCVSADDVQAKVRYLLDGTVGQRDTLLVCLDAYGDDLRESFLRSLIIDPRIGIHTVDKSADLSHGSRECTHEEA